MHVTFDVPRNMTAFQLAQTFAAYLLGSLAADNRDGQYGP